MKKKYLNMTVTLLSTGILLVPNIISATELTTPSTEVPTEQTEPLPVVPVEEVLDTPELVTESTVEPQATDTITENLRATIINGKWGTSPISFDTTTQTLTISAGTLSAEEPSQYYVGASAIAKESVAHIVLESGVIAPQNSASLFSGFSTAIGQSYYYSNLIDISGELDTSQVQNMSNMFVNAGQLTSAGHVSVDVSRWNTSQVTNMSGLFIAWTDPTLDVSGWDTSNVTDMSKMFKYSKISSSLDLSGWDTSNVTDMSSMFSVTQLESVNTSGWDVSSVTDMSSMFSVTQLESVNTSGWDVSSVTDMSNMFYNTKNLKEIIGHESLNVTALKTNGMFQLSGIETLDLSHWFKYHGTATGFNVRSMFQGSNITTLNASGWEAIQDGNRIFADTPQLKNLDISNWDLWGDESLDLSQGFRGTQLKKIDLSTWDTAGRAKALSGLFYGATSIEEIILGPQIEQQSLRNTAIPDIDTSSGLYSGRWERIDPSVVTFESSSDLMNNYLGGSQAGKYVWQKAPEVVVKDSTIHVGETWTASDNFVSASYPTSGTSIPFSAISVTGSVDPSTPGVYEVTYSYDAGGYDKGSATATITVSAQSINGSDVTKYVNDPLPDDSEFNASATDVMGNPIGVTIDQSSVDMSKVGDYDVLITATDGQTKTVKVYVLEKFLLSVPANNNFGAYKLGDASKTLPWDTTSKVEVFASPSKNWTLTVSMVNTDTLFPYVKVGNTSISDTPIAVSSGTGDTIVSDTVSSDDFLKVDYQGVTSPGDYTGTLKWELAPTIKEVNE